MKVPDSLSNYAESEHPDFELISAGQTDEGGYYIVGSFKPVVIGPPGDSPTPPINGPFLVKDYRNVPTAFLLPDQQLRGFALYGQYGDNPAGRLGDGIVISLDQGEKDGPSQENSVSQRGIPIRTFRPVAAELEDGASGLREMRYAVYVVEPDQITDPAANALLAAMKNYIDTIGQDKAQAQLNFFY
jgi:hypothetical protein